MAMLLLLVGLLGIHAAHAGEGGMLEAIRSHPPDDFCGEPVPLTIPDVAERYEKEMLLTLWDRPQVLLWIKRSKRYLPLIAKALKARGMPGDLKYLAVAESALRPHAGSSKGAVGFWQLMPETARRYGLTVDQFVDERRSIHLSTPAALTYLQDLFDRFDSWTMAVAAYNMGEEGLTAEAIEQNTRNYYRLYLPLETQRFIFRVLAVKQVLGRPETFGFSVDDSDRYAALSFKALELDCFEGLPIRLVAEAAGTDFKTVKDLNPHIRGHYLQAGHHRIHLPPDTPNDFRKRLDERIARHDHSRSERIYVIREGDTLSGIAERFGVPLAALIIWNRIDLQRTIHPGDRLIIHERRLEDIPE
jgi:hypothetical protein